MCLQNASGLDNRCGGRLADSTMRRIFVVGTADTKGEELAYLRSVIAEAGALPVVVDGTSYADQDSLGAALVKKYQLRTVQDITSCNTCHR